MPPMLEHSSLFFLGKMWCYFLLCVWISYCRMPNFVPGCLCPTEAELPDRQKGKWHVSINSFRMDRA